MPGAEYILELYICFQIPTTQLLIFTEQFSPLPGFEPGTSPVASLYATNLAILVWIKIMKVLKARKKKRKKKEII